MNHSPFVKASAQHQKKGISRRRNTAHNSRQIIKGMTDVIKDKESGLFEFVSPILDPFLQENSGGHTGETDEASKSGNLGSQS